MSVPLGGRDEAHQHRATAASHFSLELVGLADLVTTGAFAHEDNGKVGPDDGPTDGSGYLL